MTWEAAALIALMFIGIAGDCIKATPEEWKEKKQQMRKTIKAVCVDVDKLKKTKIEAHRLISRIRPGDAFFVLTLTNGNFQSTGAASAEDLNRLCLGFLDIDADVHRSMRFVSALYDLFNGKLEPTADAIATMEAMDD